MEVMNSRDVGQGCTRLLRTYSCQDRTRYRMYEIENTVSRPTQSSALLISLEGGQTLGCECLKYAARDQQEVRNQRLSPRSCKDIQHRREQHAGLYACVHGPIYVYQGICRSAMTQVLCRYCCYY